MAGDRSRAGVARDIAAAELRAKRRQPAFNKILVSGEDDLVSLSNASLTLAAGSGITIATNATTGTATISATSVGFVIENRTSDPVSPAEGQIWLRTDL